MDRLQKFEEMLVEVKRLHEDASARVDELKASGKTRGTAINQAIATKMTYKNMLIMYERFGLID